FIDALAERFLRFGMGNDAIERGGSTRASDQDIEIANGFTAAPQAAGCFGALDAGERLKIGDQLIRGTAREAEQKPAGALSIGFYGTQNFFFELGAHPRKGAQFLFAAD